MESWLNLEGKTVIVTGGASGIGRAVALAYQEQGANVVVCDINPEPPLFPGTGRNPISYMVTDITSIKSIKDMVLKVKERFRQIDILVNNAGINIPRLLIDPLAAEGPYELDEAVFGKVMDINLKGVFFCTQIVGRELVKNRRGVVINISSESGLEGSEGQSIYAATKNAVNSATRSWAKELGKLGVRVVGVAPGILEATGLRTIEYEKALAYTRGITIEQLRKDYLKTSTIPLGRSGKLAEVADLVCYLGSERASYIHGVTYAVGGGKARG